MKNLSIRYKLFFTMAGTVVLFALLSVLLVNMYLRIVLKKEMINNGKLLAAAISSHVADEILINDLVQVATFFEDTLKINTEVAYVFIEKDGQVPLHTFNGGFPVGLLDIGHAGAEPDYVIVRTGNTIFYDFAAPIFGGKAGILRLGMSGKMIAETIGNTTKYILYSALSVVAVILAVSILISRRLIDPLSMLTASAEKIAGGDYSKKIPVYGGDEVGKLSRTFNKMGEAVQLREKELREINAALEKANADLHGYIEELDRTRDKLIKTKQDLAVAETSRALLHHMRQPLTYLTLAIDIVVDEIRKDGAFDDADLPEKLKAVEDAGGRLSQLLKKFEGLKDYKTVTYSDETRIIDIEE